MVNELYQSKNCLGEAEFDFSVEQILPTLYLPLGRTSNYQGFFSLGTGGLKKTDIGIGSFVAEEDYNPLIL
jgi:hypothetical protein